MQIDQLPELLALRSNESLIRIPSQTDVPVSKRVRRLIDTPAFQRLAQISQLGVVRFVYPGATHNRFEHSLGVYRNSLLFLQSFCQDQRFVQAVSAKDAELLLLAAIFHDVGHWPFAHPIEDIQLPGLPTHEEFASNYLNSPEVTNLLAVDWDVRSNDVLDVINRRREGTANKILCSILSGPIDIDKMDYLYRDSLHSGVPYGQNFDAARLIRSLCLNEDGDKLAITRKGRTAAELMVFARYVMFSEVYWHHAVRSATAMFQRAFYLWHCTAARQDGFKDQIQKMFTASESEMIRQLSDSCDDPAAASLLDSLFGSQRKLYKRVAAFGLDDNEMLYEKIAQQPYQRLVDCGQRLTDRLAKLLGISIESHEILIDAPPVGLEVQFDVDVYYPENDSFRRLGDVSPVVKTLAQRQFDDFVKQVRVFVAPGIKQAIMSAGIDVSEMLNASVGDR